MGSIAERTIATKNKNMDIYTSSMEKESDANVGWCASVGNNKKHMG